MLRSSLPALRSLVVAAAATPRPARAAPAAAECGGGPDASAARRTRRSCAAATGVDASPLWSSMRFYASRTAPLLAATPPPGTEGGGDLDYEFDYLAGVRHDAAVETAKKSIDSIVVELAPANAPPEALAKIRTYLTQHPVDALILTPQVQITHIENAETGVEERVHLSPMDVKDAMEQAQLRKMNLVQMGSRGTEVAYCRLRRERLWILKLVQAEMEQAEGLMGDPAVLTAPGEAATTAAGAEGGEAHAPAHTRQPQQYMGKTKPLIDHQFRDAVDAHFVSWRSKKIVQDLRKGHAVKVTIKDFQSPEAAIHKLREMCNAMKAYAESEKLQHHFTSIVANDREASVSFSPPTANKSGTASKGVRYPTEKDWASAQRRMEDACQKAGRVGTYMKSGKLKPRNVGATMYRVDKYGRRID